MSSEEATTTAAQEQTDGGTEASGATAQAREEEFVPFTDAGWAQYISSKGVYMVSCSFHCSKLAPSFSGL